MPKMFGLARIGRDVEIRHLSNGDAVCNISLAFSYGKKGADGYRPTQWVDASLFGKRAEALAPYLLKKGVISVTLDEVHIETYQGQNGEGHKLVGKVIDIELTGNGGQASAPTQNAPAPQQQRQQAPQQSQQRGAPQPDFSDMDDEIPFGNSITEVSDAMGQSKSHLRAKYGRGLSLKHVNQGEF